MAIRLSLKEDRVEETHEINVTPFIDVILVLLIIFMVAAPLSIVDVNPAPRPDKPLYLFLVLGETPVKREDLGGALDTAARGDKEQRVFVLADRSVSYGSIMELMNLLRSAGYLKIGLVGMEAGPAQGPSPEARPAPALSDTMPSETKPAEAKP